MAKEDYKGIWVFAEQQNGTLNPVTYELLAKAQELKAHNGEAITAVLLGSKVAHLAAGLIAGGADQVIVAEHENLASYSARPYQQALTELAEKYKPSIIMYPATSLGRDFAPRMMISLRPASPPTPSTSATMKMTCFIRPRPHTAAASLRTSSSSSAGRRW